MLGLWKAVTSKAVAIEQVEPLVVSPRARFASGTVAHTWPIRWVLMLVLVYAASAVVTMRPIVDPDIWWHLRTGQWVVEHGTVPLTDPFSAHGAGHRWIAYSWLFALAIYGVYQWLGHVGIVLYALLGGLTLTTAILFLILRFEYRISRAIALTAVSIGAIAPALTPRSYLFTILLFIVEIYVLFDARETGRTSPLWILPPMFVLWANLHIQFVYGLAVIGMALAESLVVRLGRDARRDLFAVRQSIPFRPLLFTAVACAVATLVTPYGLNIYRPVIEIGSHRIAYNLIIELGAPTFRQPANWVFLLVALAAVYSLGRRRDLQLFPTLLMAAGAYFSFTTRRDVWFLVVASVTIIAVTWGDRRLPLRMPGWRAVLAGALGLCAIVIAIAAWRDLSETKLEAALAAEYPAAAVAAVRQQQYPGPLYNTFDWGGFLIWRLPEHPVSMDGRSNVHGDERILRSLLTSTGKKGWSTDAELRAARLFILPADLALTELLRRDREYELVYEDAVAVVFARRSPDTAAGVK